MSTITNANLVSRLDAINYAAPGHSIQTPNGLAACSFLDLGNSRPMAALYLVHTRGGIILRAKTKGALYDQMGGYLLGLQEGYRRGEAAGRAMAAREDARRANA